MITERHPLIRVTFFAPNSGGILSYATGDNAWLVEPGGENFAAAVREVIDDPNERERRIANAIETARANTREASTDRLFATYDMLWEDFQSRKELFTDIEESKKFDFVKEAVIHRKADM